MLGVLLSLAAALGFGGSAVLARVGLQYVSPVTGTLVSLLVGIVITTTLALVLHFDEIWALTAIAFGWFLLVGVLNYPLGRLLNFNSVSKVGVARATPVVGASPLFAAALAVTIGGETMTWTIFVGTLAIVGGIALIVSQK
ncbi:MAG: DMT family transporter [Chloroflexi bacterium]|nr:DMT family transporter [Chloroflexota bacterium]MCH9040523.1 DMT family transporter [Chloroflexota bacterium]MCI0813186.1 DMT family transporter [Chloroflexota bacterium]MCI0841810.1 DMT family transporter [Chloroflexota bacterium]MCI0868228.1 DMT family transporter [Chloroflexota bacterium]